MIHTARPSRWSRIIVILVFAAMATGCTAEDAVTSSVSHGVPSADEIAYLDEVGKSLAQFYRVSEPPEDVPVVRWVLPEEADDARRNCIEAAGYPMGTDGSFNAPPAQLDSFNLVQYTCWMSYPIIPKYAAAWGAEQITAQYAWTVEYLVPCLEGEGYTISDVPSEGTFVATWDTSSTFFPFAQVIPLVDGEESLRLERTCPQIAPSAVLWEGEEVSNYPLPAGHPEP